MFVEHETREANAPSRELDEVSKTLLKAAEAMERYGKGSNIMEIDCTADGTGKVCARIAIMRGLGRENDPLFDAADIRLQNSLGMNFMQVQAWSDRSPQHEVVAKLRAVALGG